MGYPSFGCMQEHEALRKAIRDLHDVDSTWIETVPVHETFQGETVWQGEVEVFELVGHPKAKHAYAWSYPTGEGTRRRYIAGTRHLRSPRRRRRRSSASRSPST